MGQTHDASVGRTSPLSQFAPFEGYPSTCPPLNTGASSQTLRPIAPTPLQINQQHYYAARDPPYVPSGSPFMAPPASQSFLGDPSPIPLSAGISGTFQSGSHGPPYVSTPHHAAIPGRDPGYHRWSGAPTAEHIQDTPFLTRLNISPSFDPLQSASTRQLHSAGFSPEALPNHAPGSQFNVTANDDSPLTSTQIAAFGGQPLPPDHPFYLEMRAQIHDAALETASQGESMSLVLSRRLSYSFAVVDLGQAILLTESQNMTPQGTVLRDLFSVPLSI